MRFAAASCAVRDATRISSDGIKPHIEWADPADILHSALDRCQHRMSQRKLALDLPQDLPLLRVDPILVQQALHEPVS